LTSLRSVYPLRVFRPPTSDLTSLRSVYPLRVFRPLTSDFRHLKAAGRRFYFTSYSCSYLILLLKNRTSLAAPLSMSMR